MRVCLCVCVCVSACMRACMHECELISTIYMYCTQHERGNEFPARWVIKSYLYSGLHTQEYDTMQKFC